MARRLFAHIGGDSWARTREFVANAARSEFGAPATAVTAAALLPLADIADKQGDRELAVSLVRGFDKRFPRHRGTPGVVFLAAQLMSEHARQHEKAIHLLRALLANFPEHAVAALDRMLAKP